MRVLIPLAAALAVSACAPNGATPGADGASARAPRQCFDTSHVQNFRTDDSRVLYVRTLNNRVYALKPSAGCQDLPDAMGIALLPGRGGLDRLCPGDWTDVAIQGGLSGGGCRALVDRQLTTEEIAALPERLKP